VCALKNAFKLDKNEFIKKKSEKGGELIQNTQRKRNYL
jgi:hypothetical protein